MISGLLLTPLDTVHIKDIINYLKIYLRNQKVDIFVVGEPKHLNDTPSDSAQMVDNFIKQLNKNFPNVITERFDERFTSKIALQTVQNAGLKKKDRANKELLDSISATLILQSYMENMKFKSKLVNR